MSAETITDKLHAQADAKLKAFIETRFGDLFEMCGGHTATQINKEDHSPVFHAVQQVGVKDADHIWHGAVWQLGKTMLFAQLRDKWRTREVTEWMEKVERLSVELDEVRAIAEYAHDL